MCLTKHPPRMGRGYFNRSPPSSAQIRNPSEASLPWELQYPWNHTIAISLKPCNQDPRPIRANPRS